MKMRQAQQNPMEKNKYLYIFFIKFITEIDKNLQNNNLPICDNTILHSTRIRPKMPNVAKATSLYEVL